MLDPWGQVTRFFALFKNQATIPYLGPLIISGGVRRLFVSVLFWGWLLGVGGLLPGVPIIMIIKAVCDRTEDLQAVGELPGEQLV